MEGMKDNHTLSYDPSINRFKDYSGVVIHDLSLYFPTWKLDKWKKTKKNSAIKDKSGKSWTLLYDDCDHKCITCPNRCGIYYLVI